MPEASLVARASAFNRNGDAPIRNRKLDRGRPGVVDKEGRIDGVGVERPGRLLQPPSVRSLAPVEPYRVGADFRKQALVHRCTRGVPEHDAPRRYAPPVPPDPARASRGPGWSARAPSTRWRAPRPTPPGVPRSGAAPQGTWRPPRSRRTRARSVPAPPAPAAPALRAGRLPVLSRWPCRDCRRRERGDATRRCGQPNPPPPHGPRAFARAPPPAR